MAAPNQLLDFAMALKKRRWQVAVPALLIAAVGCSFAVIVPKKYLLSTRIEIAESRLGTDAQGKGGRETAARREAPSVADHMNFARVQKVIEADLRQWPAYMQLPESERPQFITDLMKRLSASSTDRTNNRGGVVFVDIRFQDEDKNRAARFLEELSSSWLEDMAREEEEKLVLERTKLKEISDDLQQELNSTQDRFYTLAKQLGLDPTEVLNPTARGREDTGDWTFAALKEARTELQRTETSLATAEFELKQAQMRYDAEPAEDALRERTDPVDNSEEVRNLEDMLEKLETDCERLRPDNSQYRRKREEIEKLKEKIRELEEEERPSAPVLVTGPNPRKQEYLAAVRAKEDDVARLSAERDVLQKREDELSLEARARTEQKQELENLRNDFEEARDALNAKQRDWRSKDHELRLLESSPEPWKIAQVPVAARAGVTPNPWLISAFSVVAGLAVGVGLAVASEFARSSYRTVADLASVMTIPVLGAIETIVTRRERRRRQANRAVAALSTAMIVGCIGWVTWMWATAPERLPIEVQAAIERLREALG